MGWESSGVVGFDLGPLIQGQTRTAKLKSAYNSLIIGPRGLGWPLLEGQMRTVKLESAYNSLRTRLLLVLEVWDGKPAYRKSWAGNLLAWSDLTLGPSFKVK